MHTKMEVNAAIGRLIENEEFDLEAARVLINFALGIKLSGRSVEYYSSKKNDSSIQGYVSGVGNVDYKKPGEKIDTEKTFGIHEERVGSYKIRRFKNNVITFHHFWKSDIATASMADNKPKVYYLHFDCKTFEPISLFIKDRPRIIPVFFLPLPKGRSIIMNIELIFNEYIQGRNKGKRIYSGYGLFIKID